MKKSLKTFNISQLN